MTTKPRLPIPRQRPGTITIRLAANRECPKPDFWASWGQGTDTPTACLCLSTITTLGHELTKRGYDPRSLRFSAQKATAHPPPQSAPNRPRKASSPQTLTKTRPAPLQPILDPETPTQSPSGQQTQPPP